MADPSVLSYSALGAAPKSDDDRQQQKPPPSLAAHSYSTIDLLRKSGDLYYSHIRNEEDLESAYVECRPIDNYETEAERSYGYVKLTSHSDEDVASPQYFQVIERKPGDENAFVVIEPEHRSKKAQVALSGEGEGALLSKLIAKTPAEKLKKILLQSGGNQHTLAVQLKLELEKAKQSALQDKSKRPREWNEELQSLLCNGIECYTRLEINRLSALCNDFVECAENYAKIIVNELGLSYEHKTIKPAGIGGVAGGAKYIVHGILFKFCLDPIIATKPKVIYMYGGDKPRDDYAMKVGGLELQGLESWSSQDIRHLYFPLMALIDYKGFRLVATSLLPIKGTKTLRYGSSDAGKTVLATDEKLNELIKRTAERINLKGHTVGDRATLVYGPGDIEGHLGTDGRYYLLDFARTMPPEAPKIGADGKPVEPRAIFYKMLRPELVYVNSVPLSSDVFSGWGLKDTNRDESQREVIAATRRITEEKIPDLAKELMETIDLDKISNRYFSRGDPTTPEQMHKFVETVKLPLRMHTKGINLRYVGHLRQQMIHHRDWRLFLLSWAVARLLRQKLREKLRATMRSTHSSEIACKETVAEFFNQVLFAGRRKTPATAPPERKESSRWTDLDIIRELELKYENILTAEEKTQAAEFSDWSVSSLCIRLVIAEFLHMKMIKMSPSASAMLFECRSDFSSVRLVERDIAELCASVRYAHYHNIMDALSAQFQAAEFSPVSLPSEIKVKPVDQLSDDYRIEFSRSDDYRQRYVERQRKRAEAMEMAMETKGKEMELEKELCTVQADRLLTRAEQSLYTSFSTYPLCHLTPLVWGRVSSDRAVIAAESAQHIYRKTQRLLAHKAKQDKCERQQQQQGGEQYPWTKAKKLFRRAEEQFAYGISVGGARGTFHAANCVLLEAWAESLSVQAAEAEKLGLEEEAARLRERAQQTLSEALRAQDTALGGADGKEPENM